MGKIGIPELILSTMFVAAVLYLTREKKGGEAVKKTISQRFCVARFATRIRTRLAS